jgi:hypothetical protein
LSIPTAEISYWGETDRADLIDWIDGPSALGVTLDALRNLVLYNGSGGGDPQDTPPKDKEPATVERREGAGDEAIIIIHRKK